MIQVNVGDTKVHKILTAVNDSDFHKAVYELLKSLNFKFYKRNFLWERNDVAQKHGLMQVV
jgi:hypothetical protein